MTRDVHDILARYAEEYEVVRELHDVPPYRVHEVRLDGERLVLKRDVHPRGHAALEGKVQRYVAERTSVPTPRVEHVGEDYFVAAWADDVPEEDSHPDEEWARATGRMLATLHAETADEVAGFGEPRIEGGRLDSAKYDRWSDAVRARIAHHREYLEENGKTADLDAVDAVDSLVRDYPSLFDGAESDENEPVLCHGNALADHVAVSEGEATCVIDFEHALLAPAAYDYWRTALPTFEDTDHREDEAHAAFREGYESVRSLPAGIDRSRRYALVNAAGYFESLYLQQNKGPDARAEHAEWLRETVHETVVELREERA